ncbi:MAG: choice-of-anchor D domain-containing protein [Candidatus Kapaibacterium sp.]|nr:MAG: choice-of-anchor D domain-containing protein [Candidatus Kapabacteria bacterium]
MTILCSVVMLCVSLFRNLLVLILLQAASILVADAQSFTVFQPDASAYPLVKAQFYALSADGRPMLSLTNSNFSVRDNRTDDRKIVSIEYPPETRLRAVSAVLAVDVSGSMAQEERMTFARDAATDWVRTMPLDISECALTSFDDDSYVNQDFTRLRPRLLSAVQALKPLNGTSYDKGFLQKLTGCLNVARRGAFKRVVVFLTDGLGGGVQSNIVEAARRDSVSVYCIALGLKMPLILKNVADSSGGAWFENITSRDELIRIYRKILYETQNIQPATITWKTDVACSPSRTTLVSLRSAEGELQSTVKYDTPPISLVRLQAQPRSVVFREVAIGNSQGQRITLRALFQPVTITAIETNNPEFKIAGVQLPITVSAGTVTTFIVGFTPQDSTPQVGRIDIRTATCDPISLYARATYSNKQAAATQTLSITAPSEGDLLYSGADTVLSWSGIMPSEAVELEYSTDAGSTWKNITESAAGLRTIWRVPPVASGALVNGDRSRPMRVRARQVWQMPEGSSEPDMLLDAHWGSILSAKFSPDGTKILTASADRTMRLWDAYTGVSLITYEGHTGLVADAAFNADGTRIISASHDNTCRIWDAETAQMLVTGYGQGLNQIFFSQMKMTGAERLQFASTDSRKFFSAVFSPDGKEVMTTSDIGMAVQWKAASMRPVGFVRQVGGSVYSVRYNQAGNKIVTAGGDFSARLWSVQGRSPEQSFFGHTAQVLHAAFSPDEKNIVTASEDGTARVWDIKTARPLFTMAHRASVWSAEYSPDGKRIVTASLDATVRLWDARTGKQLAVLRSANNDKLGFQYAEFSPDGSRIVGAGINAFGNIWEIGGGFLQEAESKIFRVIAPQATVRDASMGGVAVGAVKDSLVAILSNPDKALVRVMDARIVGANAEDFSLVSGIPPFDLASGTTKSLEVRFQPRATGNRTATLEIITLTDTLRAKLTGEGQQRLLQAAPLLEFGKILVNKRKDTTITLVRNVGTQSLTITRIQALGPNTEAFSASLVQKRLPFTVQAGDSVSVQASFTPKSKGLASGGVRIDVKSDAQESGKPLQVLFVGDGVTRAMQAELGAELLSLTTLGTASDTVSNMIKSNSLRIEELETVMVRPVLNYLFFDEASAEIPARYRRLLADSTQFFQENTSDSLLRTLNTAQNLQNQQQSGSGSGLEGYYDILNVFGKRLRERVNTSLKVLGCNSDDGAEKGNTALSRKRAEAVRDYLQAVWEIDARRISIQARNKPERASNPLDSDGAAENRRVELFLEPQEAMSPQASNEAIFTAEPSVVRLSPRVVFAKMETKTEEQETDKEETINEWSIDMMLGQRIITTLSGTGALPATIDYRPTSAELRRFALSFQQTPSSNSPLRFRLRASNGAGESVAAESAIIPFSLHTLKNKRFADSTNTRVERFALTFFDFDKATVSPQNALILNLAKSRMNARTDVSVLGYTDRMGDAAYNKRLSSDRATAVAALIPALPSQNKQVRGIGESILLYDNSLPEGRFYCRMVEIFLKTHP